MTKKSLGATILGVAAIGAIVHFSVGKVGRYRTTAALKEKGRQTSEKIKRLVEKESSSDSDSSGIVASDKLAGHRAGLQEGVRGDDKSCGADEFFGSGPEQVQVDAVAWTRFMGEYHAAKNDLLQWISANQAYFSPSMLQKMESEVRSTRVMRPQEQIEPELTWRGIAAWTRPKAGSVDSEERPALIHVGSGFMDLFQKDRSRARFEIARLIAQAWSPCELAEAGKTPALNSYFKCMGLTDDQLKCAPGAVSEATWALSTAVASLVSRPGCAVPAFADSKSRECLGAFKEVGAAGRGIASVSGVVGKESGPRSGQSDAKARAQDRQEKHSQ